MKMNAPGFGEATLGRGLLRRLRSAAMKQAPPVPRQSSGWNQEPRALSRLAPGDRDVVCRLEGDGPVRQRLLELGVTPGTAIEIIRFAPLGDPIEIRVRGYHLSLRRREAEAVWVGREDSERDGTDTAGTAPGGAGG